MNEMPEALRLKLVEVGHKFLDVGDATLHLRSGAWTRTLTLDERKIPDVEFPSSEIDWDVVERALETEMRDE